MKSQKVHFVSLGCPKNRVDTEVMLGLSDAAGYRIVPEAEGADVIVVNTCGFIGEAKEESIDTILEMAKLKEAGSCSKLVVTGCLTQRYPDELRREMPEVDVFLGSSDMPSIVAALRGEADKDSVGRDLKYLYDEHTPRLMTTGASAYVKVAEGCDRPCGFCIIPKMRGEQRSRSIASIEAEVRDLVAAGTVEINLVAQDLTNYGKDLDELQTLAALLRRLARVPGLGWLRLHYAYPSATTDELLDVIASEPTIVKYLDVPLQHVSDDMLRLMRRGHVGKTIRRLVERVRERVPGVSIRTTFIVGHPGETEPMFEELCAFVKESQFDQVGVFTYSHEEGTHSATLADAVPKRTAERRRRELMRLQRTISRKKMKALVGQQIEVLVEGPSEESEYVLRGRHAGQAPEVDGCVFLSLGEDSELPRAGDRVLATVTGFADYDVAATVTGLAVAAPKRKSKRSLRVVG